VASFLIVLFASQQSIHYFLMWLWYFRAFSCYLNVDGISYTLSTNHVCNFIVDKIYVESFGLRT